MLVNPDTDAIYQEAIDLQARVEKYEAKRFEFGRLARDVELELLCNGFLPDSAPEIRLEAVRLRGNQILQERHPDVFKYLDEENAAIAAIRLRNEGIVAAGWAENFVYSSETRRRLDSQFGPKGEIES